MSFFSCAVSNNPLREKVKLLQKGKLRDDTSFVYALPYEVGKSYRLVQGYFGPWSHQERAALDFLMKKGTKITAARDGVVLRIKEDGTKGGWSRKYRSEGNYVIVQHNDGSRAGYWHLQKDGALVNPGDTVKQGQVIALSGKTGFAAVSHLHFLVWDFDHNRKWQQMPTRFQTSKGIKYLKGIKKYRNKAPEPQSSF